MAGLEETIKEEKEKEAIKVATGIAGKGKADKQFLISKERCIKFGVMSDVPRADYEKAMLVLPTRIYVEKADVRWQIKEGELLLPFNYLLGDFEFHSGNEIYNYFEKDGMVDMDYPCALSILGQEFVDGLTLRFDGSIKDKTKLVNILESMSDDFLVVKEKLHALETSDNGMDETVRNLAINGYKENIRRKDEWIRYCLGNAVQFKLDEDKEVVASITPKGSRWVNEYVTGLCEYFGIAPHDKIKTTQMMRASKIVNFEPDSSAPIPVVQHEPEATGASEQKAPVIVSKNATVIMPSEPGKAAAAGT
jgi:hypothetical protein